jgi:spore maturation protein CgeB
MRIFYASDDTPNAFMPSSRIWYTNLFLPLVDLGHDVVRFRYDLTPHFRNLDPRDPAQKAFIDRNRPLLEQELLRQIKSAHQVKPVDLFFSYFYSACATRHTIHEIRSMGIKTMNWFCNASYQFYLIEDLAPAYDWCLVPEKMRLDDYRRIGANPLYCQEAANPIIYKSYDLPVEFDVTFVGQAYSDREDYVRYLYDHGIAVRVWGYGWKQPPVDTRRRGMRRLLRLGKKTVSWNGWLELLQRLIAAVSSPQKTHCEPAGKAGAPFPDEVAGEALSDTELIRMYSRSKISLGFSTCGDTHKTSRRIVQIRLRDFEVPMSGGFYLVEYMKELEEFFDIGTEIECYRDKVELLDKIKYYLAHDEEREAIRMAGYRRARAEHTWQNRFTDAFKTAGLVP